MPKQPGILKQIDEATRTAREAARNIRQVESAYRKIERLVHAYWRELVIVGLIVALIATRAKRKEAEK